MTRIVFAALTAALLAAGAARAGDSVPPEMLGTWTHRADGHKVTVEVKKDRVRCTVSVPDGYSVTVDADYVLTRDGILMGALRGKTVKAEDGKEMEKRLFYCRVAIQKDTLTVSNLEYDNEDARKVIEGKYTRLEKRKTKAAGLSGASIGAGTGALVGGAVGNERSRTAPTPPTGARQPTGAGWLRVHRSELDGKRAYVWEGAGDRRLYATAGPGVDLESHVNQSVELYGEIVYRGDLRSYYLVATEVRCCPAEERRPPSTSAEPPAPQPVPPSH